MTKTILATAFDSKYQWGREWRESLEEHCNVPHQIIDMDSVSTQMPNNIIQHGEFLDYLPAGEPDDCILFSDADCVLQRPFNGEELKFFDSLRFGDMAADYNLNPFWTLAMEAGALGVFNRDVADGFLRDFPGFNTMGCYCTGVVAATRETWQMHRRWFERSWSKVDLMWPHYAKIQWLMSYIINRRLEPAILPKLVTRHGFFGQPPEMSFEGRNVLIDGELIAIRHAINLEPPKLGGPPTNTVIGDPPPRYSK